MPDPFDVNDARRALDEVPAPDLWDEAARRAADGSVVPLTTDGDRVRRPGRWLAAAAVAALAVGTAALVLNDDDQAVDTTPASPGTTTAGEEPVTVYRANGACALGITGEPLPQPVTVSPAETFVAGSVGTFAGGQLNETQAFGVQVPGEVVTDLVGERVEDVELRRGTGQLWFQADGGVQVRWFTGSQEACESFTVTVGGGTEDGNRHAAVDLAERVLMPSELGDRMGANLERTAWALDHSTVGDEEIDGNGAAFSILDGEATWSDGCNTFSAPYTLPSPTQLALGDVTSTELPCPTNPTTQAIASVMSSATIEVAFGSGVDALFLTAGDTTLTLRPAQTGDDTTTSVGDDAEPSAGPQLAGTEWRVAALYHGDEVVLPRPTAGALVFSFGDTTVAWDDGCNSAGGTWSVDPETGDIVVTDAVSTAIGCTDVGEGTQVWEVIGAVMGADRISARMIDGQLELSGGEEDRILLAPT